MKTIGIIGGLGPETTSEFYLRLIFKCYQRNKEQRPPILMWSIPMQYKIENDLIQSAIGEERYIPYLVEAAKRLESGGADFLVIPCNSVHIFIEEVRKAVNIPVLSIVEETANFLKEQNIDKVGILATLTTIKHGLYQKPLESKNIQVALPNENDQLEVGELINRLVLSRNGDEDKAKLLKIIENFRVHDVHTVVLACTDLQLLTPSHSDFKIYDSMEILADSSVERILTN